MSLWPAIGVLLTLGQQPQGLEVPDSILGVKIGVRFEQAEAILNPLGEGGGRTSPDGSKRYAWTLKEGPLNAIALRTDKTGSVKWVSGFFKPGQEKPFAELGDLAKAQHTANEAIWTVNRPHGAYRVVAKGGNRKASVVYLLKL